MSNKPTMKSEVAIDFSSPMSRIIYFYSTEDAVTDFYTFGLVEPHGNHQDYYRITVDARYDFGEVVAYLERYGK